MSYGSFQGSTSRNLFDLTECSAKPSLVTRPETGMSEITPGKWASIRQPHWHRHLDVKCPTRAVEELHQVAATRTERRLLVQVESTSVEAVNTRAFPSTMWRNFLEQDFWGLKVLAVRKLKWQ